MSLTGAERAAGRQFLDTVQETLARRWHDNPADACIPPFLAHYRHNCAGHNARSWSLELHEVYQPSPAYVVGKNGEVVEYTTGSPEDTQDLLDAQEETGLRHLSVIDAVVPAGRFGFITQEGRCPDCGLTVCSRTGRLVDAHVRPPMLLRRARG